jgi:hypothetical protein
MQLPLQRRTFRIQPITSPDADLAQARQALRSGGITLTMTAARTAESIGMNQSNFSPRYGHETYT